MNRFVAMGIAVSLLGLAATAFAGAKLDMKDSAPGKHRASGRGRPVERGPVVLTPEQEDADVEDLHQLEASLKDLNRFNTDGKAPLNTMPMTGERSPQSLPRSMNETTP